MQNHTYSTDNDYRIKVVALIAITAFVTGNWLASVLSWITSVVPELVGLNGPPLLNWALSPLTTLGLQPEAWVPTTGILFAIYFWAFNNHIWQWKVTQQTPIVSTPDLSGTWEVHIKQTESSGEEPSEHRADSSDDDTESQVIEEQVGTADIEQSWRKIQILMDFDNSTSASLSASFITGSAKKRLYYYYRNEPSPHADGSAQVHYGTTGLKIVSENALMEGEYFTDRFRNTSGSVVLKREEGE